MKRFDRPAEIKRTGYAIGYYGGQTNFYISWERFNAIGAKKVVEIIKNIFNMNDSDFGHIFHGAYKNSYSFELPPVKKGSDNEGKEKELIDRLNKEFETSNK